MKLYDRLFLRWYWPFNRDFWENFRPRRLIEQDTIIETLEQVGGTEMSTQGWVGGKCWAQFYQYSL